MSLRNGVGTIGFLASRPHPDWMTNDTPTKFKPVTSDGVTVECAKHANQVFEIRIMDADGDCASWLYFINRMPSPNPMGVDVTVKWNKGTVELFLNGRLAVNDVLPPKP